MPQAWQEGKDTERERQKKKKPNTCQSVGFVGCPLGGRKNGIKLTLQREAAVMPQQHHPCSPGAWPGRWLRCDGYARPIRRTCPPTHEAWLCHQPSSASAGCRG